MKLSLIIFLAILSLPISAQSVKKDVHTREQFWTGYFNQTRFSKRFGTWLDLHYRRTDNFVDRNFQAMARGAVTYFFKDNLRLNIGYAYIHHYPAHGSSTARPEHRPWQQIWWSQKYTGYQTLQWLRFEQRYNRKIINDELTDDYRFNYRLRYNFSLFVPLIGKEIVAKTPFFILIDELFINMGKQITYNYFDQNRFFAGFGYQITSHLNAQLGYMNLFQQEAAGNKFISNHAIRLFVFHSLDLRNKEE